MTKRISGRASLSRWSLGLGARFRDGAIGALLAIAGQEGLLPFAASSLDVMEFRVLDFVDHMAHRAAGGQAPESPAGDGAGGDEPDRQQHPGSGLRYWGGHDAKLFVQPAPISKDGGVASLLPENAHGAGLRMTSRPKAALEIKIREAADISIVFIAPILGRLPKKPVW
jgi:hypothetical protein